MAEGLLRRMAGTHLHVYSAGTKPTCLNPNAVRAMQEIGIDISEQYSKSVDEFADQQFDFVITVCDNAKESCPVFRGSGKKIHRSFRDPAALSPEHQFLAFREVRNEIEDWLEEFVREQVGNA